MHRLKGAKVTALLLLVLMAAAAYAQQPDWVWAKRVGGTGSDKGRGLTTDSQGNQFIIGIFTGSVSFGSTTLTSSGLRDVFIAKINSLGTWQWAKKAGGRGDDMGRAITLDNSGNVYIMGHFPGTATFGTTTLTSSGSYDVFIAKLDGNGNWLWAVSAGGGNEDWGEGITTDSAGSIYFTGLFNGTAAFGSTTLAGNGDRDVVVAKLDASGNWLWAAGAGGDSTDGGNGIFTDSAGNSYVTGTFKNQARYGTRILSSRGGGDVFVAKLDASGNWLWAEGAGGIGSDSGSGIAIGTSGAVYLTGRFESTAHFGNTVLTSQGSTDVFVAKLPATSSLHVGSSPLNVKIIKDSLDTGFLTPHVFVDTETGLTGSYTGELDYHLFETVNITAIAEDTSISLGGTFVEPPAVMEAIGGITMNMDQIHAITPLDMYFSSIDPAVTYSVSGNDQIDWQAGAPHTVTLLPETGWHGTEHLAIRATDSWGRYAEQIVRVTVWETWFLVEDFEHGGGLPVGWNVTAGGSSGFPWQPVSANGDGYLMKTMATLGGTVNERLVSKTYDLSAYEAIEVSFDTSFLPYGSGTGTFAYSLDNVTYTTIETLSQATDGSRTFSLAALTGKPNVRFRWTYYNPLANTGQNNHWSVDDFTIYARLRDLTPPTQVTGFTVQRLTTSSANLAWTSSSDTYFNRYQLYISNDPEVNPTDMLWSVSDDPLLNTASTYQTVVMPLAMGQYWCAIRAEDMSGNTSDFSETVSFILEDCPPVLSDPFPALQPDPEWSQSLEVSFGCTISDISPLDMQSLAYRIDLNQNGVYDEDESWTPIQGRTKGRKGSREVMAISLDLTLNDDGIYAWEIKAGDLIGNMAYSGGLGIEGIADDWIIRADAMPPAAIDDFFVQEVGPHSGTLQWTASSDLYFSGYKIYYSTLPEVGSEDSLWDGANDPNLYFPGSGLVSTVITGLAPATRYYFLIQATDESGWITQHPTVITAMTASEYQPMQPQAVVVSVQNDLLTIDWEDVTHDIMGNPITISYYEVHVSNQPYFECSPDTQLQTVQVSQLSLEGLTEYADRLFFKVIAVTGAIRDPGIRRKHVK